MEVSKDYNDILTKLYKLKPCTDDEIYEICKDIKNKLIETNMFTPSNILKILSTASLYNNRSMKSYWAIFKKIYEDYRPDQIISSSSLFNYLIYKEYGLNIDQNCKNPKEKFELYNSSLDFLEKNTIYKAIMNDDKELFISLTEREGFDSNQMLQNDLYPYSKAGYSYLELCSYYGSVNCFKFLRTKYNSEITQTCHQFSFLGGNPDIMSECLKCIKPDVESMMYAIISHNIDFVTFLKNEYNIEIELLYCYHYNNYQAFFVYLDQTNEVNNIIFLSPRFFVPSLWEYFISHGVDINEKDSECRTTLHRMVTHNRKQIAEFLILHGADINAKDNKGRTALHLSALSNRKQIAELLVSHGADISIKDNEGKTALQYSLEKNNKEIADLLKSHGSNFKS